MKVFVCGSHEYEYDENLWQLVELTKEAAEHYECSHTLKYVGPIVDGNIVGTVPKFPVFVGTFDGLKDLIHIPTGLPKSGLFKCFKGCAYFNPSVEEVKKFCERMGSGVRAIAPFSGCASSHIIDVDKQRDDLSIIQLLFNLSLSDVIICSNSTKWINDDPGLRNRRRLRDFFDDTGVSALLRLIDVFDNGKIKHWIFSTGGIVIFQDISRSSEMLYNASCTTAKHAFASAWSGSRLWGDRVTYCYRLADDFVVDTDDPVLIQHFGRVLDNVDLTVPYKAGLDGCIEVYGDSCITSDVCPLQASGTLVIKGSGTLVLRSSSSMQACIGTETHTGMSFGRWEPGRDKPLQKIVIDGVHVICESSVPNFSLGNYGRGDVPAVECINGGVLECPEMHGERVMIKSGAEDLCGSTKRYNCAEYRISYKVKDSGKTKSMGVF